MSHGGPTPRGLLMFLGVVGVCAAISGTFLFFYMRSVETVGYRNGHASPDSIVG
jgi:hypothetical protein